MKKIVLFIISIVLVVSLTACGVSAPTEKELTNTAVYEDFTLELVTAERFTDDTGRNLIRVHATYTNASEDPCYALSCFAVRAFQNDKEIADVSDINEGEAALIREIKKGESLSVTYVFELVDESAVEVLIGEPTADQVTIGKAIYE